jgi:GTP-binding protein HflX
VNILLSDTVGFVNKLPPTLVAAFRATLEELADADVLVQVADVSHPNLHERMRVVKDTLMTLELGAREQLLVLNKADALRGAEGEALREALGAEFPRAVLVSGRTGEGLDALRDRLADAARSRWTSVSVTLPYDRGGAMLQRIRERGALRREDYSEGGIAIEADVPADLAAELRAAGS